MKSKILILLFVVSIVAGMIVPTTAIAESGENPNEADDGQNPNEADDGQNPNEADDGQNPNEADDGQNPNEADDGKAPAVELSADSRQKPTDDGDGDGIPDEDC